MTRPLPDCPLVVAYGLGVHSTAMLVEFVRCGIRPDLILCSRSRADDHSCAGTHAITGASSPKLFWPPVWPQGARPVVRVLPTGGRNAGPATVPSLDSVILQVTLCCLERVSRPTTDDATGFERHPLVQRGNVFQLVPEEGRALGLLPGRAR